jgi:hypothetical protein
VLPVTLKAGSNALLGSDTLLKLTHLILHSTSSQTLLDAPAPKIDFADELWGSVPVGSDA